MPRTTKAEARRAWEGRARGRREAAECIAAEAMRLKASVASANLFERFADEPGASRSFAERHRREARESIAALREHLGRLEKEI